jgi:hypothetical protein
MSDFPIEPELHVRVGRGRTLRSIEQAAEFTRSLAKQRNSREWDGALHGSRPCAPGRMRAMRQMRSARCWKPKISW